MTRSEQSRADAMADAETLRRIGQFYAVGSRRTDPASGRTYRRMAPRYLPIRDVETIQMQAPDVAAHIASVAARAAFRAVPGLREE